MKNIRIKQTDAYERQNSQMPSAAHNLVFLKKIMNNLHAKPSLGLWCNYYFLLHCFKFFLESIQSKLSHAGLEIFQKEKCHVL